ncbi:GNAT family N-acyltransferase [Aliarcobacter butzleri]|uniref:Phospholipid/glycerol acyltransferase, possible hemolysin n=1 Tax=Aliarcobacter butzleri (strain RM4018) TaxID=367737 RepID=A8ERV7_ALIB4|nr:lysophospholipid acyltransferase family protein [Aliarcobacter butzleri]ABV66681.1 phospholipid/glycerol acyltransferase, possible hemolysin [Aliarcobacter butzleri RM4018]MCG3687658.1 lysophospholipid acyltransferase family protein [Aliarcobacter butzleri]MCT7549300.1 lysophospholipid acyltransferase family protein [Aliarcobacter butzleri]MCT7558616.1 lysophospholipid acyltransferase family protein [Aliarcobacter butzleri]MCT7583393.1 lysophospholipid acyltransferase family protein [Aliarc
MIDIQKEIEKKFPKIKEKENVLKKSLLKIAKKIVHEDSINQFLSQNSHLKGFDFVDAVLDYFDFDYTVSSNDLQNIPSTGKVIIIANHPLGGLDALCLLKLVGQIRKDVKILANDFLVGFEALHSLMIPLDNFKDRQSKESIKKIYEALKNEEAIIIFPAGEVSRATPKGVKDPAWNKGFLNFAKNSNSAILPIFLDAKNSKTFYTISLINKTFSTLLLSNEMFNKKSKNINIKIGQIIPSENITPKGLNKDFLVNLYKKHLYALKKGKKSFFQTQSAIAHPVSKIDLYNELKKSPLLGQTNDGKKIYLYDYVEDSIVLKELGRLREISFRKVGEGVNKKRDIDKYDVYYQHIILYDKNELEIVGAYRIGNSDMIFKEFGTKGFYSNTLFQFNDEFMFYLQNSIELGRSFVQPKYWGTRALDYLWYGIGAYVKANPNIKYMFGPVSISGAFPAIAKDMLVFYYNYYYSSEKNLVEARTPFSYSSHIHDIKEFFTLEDKKRDFKSLKIALSNIGVNVPTLYKQYSELTLDDGVKFLDFNVDKNFGDCIDSFILVEIDKIKDSMKQRYM